MDVTALEIEKHKSCCLTVHYENFVAAPYDVIAEILEFAGLDKSQEVDKYLKVLSIYDRNTNYTREISHLETDDRNSEMQMILQGKYLFGR